MKILDNIKVIDLTLYFDSTLIISDVHIGYEEALNKKGIMIPRLQFGEMVQKIEKIFDSVGKVDKIIINGDLKHEFGTISEQEWRNVLKFLDLLARHCNEVILIKGNHDMILGPIARKRNVKVVDYYIMESKNDKKNKPKSRILVIHGDKIPGKDVLQQVSTIIIGHEHPALSLKDGARVETFKCFLKGRYKGKNLIVLPSFNAIVGGTNIMRDKTLSPFLKQNLDDFEVFAVEDKIYDFGKLKNLREKI
ncbi:MAG TPA: metallophosphoesterase [Candidatus Nanoarchaeia archaeon]|nr:metallophosphoesterase [Candidatus Nanoarchaeia archaeon]